MRTSVIPSFFLALRIGPCRASLGQVAGSAPKPLQSKLGAAGKQFASACARAVVSRNSRMSLIDAGGRNVTKQRALASTGTEKRGASDCRP